MINKLSQINFIKPGFLTTVQDLGRLGMAEFGVPYSGAMDGLSHRLANHLLQNPETAACLEMTQFGPEMEFEAATQLVFTGAIAKIYQNGLEIPLGKVIEISSGDRIKVGQFQEGQWLYMGIKGGLLTELIANSRSWYKNISSIDKIKKGDKLPYLPDNDHFIHRNSYLKINSDWFGKKDLQVYPGPEFPLLTHSQSDLLASEEFTLSPIQNRMGIHLQELIPNELDPILTAPVYPGTVQLTPSGRLILLMRDAQVTGGYPRVLHISDDSLSVLAQKRPGEKIKFSIIQ